MDEEYKKLNRIKELRRKKGVTQKEVAAAVNISQGMLTNYENGRRSPRDKMTWKKLAKYFGVSISYIMGLSEDPTSLDTAFEKYNKLLDKYVEHVNDPEVEKEFYDYLDYAIDIANKDDKLSPPPLINLDKILEVSRHMIYDFARLNDENKDKAWKFTADLLRGQDGERKMKL